MFSHKIRNAIIAGIAAVQLATSMAQADELSRADVLYYASLAFPNYDAAQRATSVAYCESTFVPEADTNYPYVGLMQVDSWLHADRVRYVTGLELETHNEIVEALKSPYINMFVAADILEEQGWYAWPYCGFLWKWR